MTKDFFVESNNHLRLLVTISALIAILFSSHTEASQRVDIEISEWPTWEK